MQRIMIIGCCGAGKSTLSLQLHQRTGLPLFHLDQIFWKKGWVADNAHNWQKNVKNIAAKSHWIIDGNYNSTMQTRLARADTIVFLDRSRWLCLWRVLKHIWTSYGKTRFDMAAGCPERFDWEFLAYTFHFYDKKRPFILKKLSKLGATQQVFILKSEQEVAAFLTKVENDSKKKFPKTF